MKVALIGLGMVSSAYVAALRDLSGDIALIGVLARSIDSSDRFLTRHAGALSDGCRAYGNVSEIAADRDVDFVILTTPPNARADIVGVLAGAGKPILMEKPVERDFQAAKALVERCEAAGVPLGIMLQHRMRPSARRMAELVAAGGLGPLRAVELSVPWWRPQSYYDAPGRGSYGRDGGGVMISQAIHTLDLMLSLTGPVAEVTAMTGTTGFHEMEAEDFVSAGLRFANGALGSVFATTAAFPGRAEGMVLQYQNASVDLQSNMLRLRWQDGREETHGVLAETGAGADPMAFTADWHRDMIADFADALRDGRPPMVTGQAALSVHHLIALIERSARRGTRVTGDEI